MWSKIFVPCSERTVAGKNAYEPSSFAALSRACRAFSGCRRHALGWTAVTQAEVSKGDIGAILYDPEAPVGGNPNGNVPVVAFLDYSCRFCREAASDLQRLVSTDGKIRFVYKDWPILAASSVYGAQLALAAKYQGKYEAARAALMSMHGHEEVAMRNAVTSAGTAPIAAS